jgi:hypothetical protein
MALQQNIEKWKIEIRKSRAGSPGGYFLRFEFAPADSFRSILARIYPFTSRAVPIATGARTSCGELFFSFSIFAFSDS